MPLTMRYGRRQVRGITDDLTFHADPMGVSSGLEGTEDWPVGDQWSFTLTPEDMKRSGRITTVTVSLTDIWNLAAGSGITYMGWFKNGVLDSTAVAVDENAHTYVHTFVIDDYNSDLVVSTRHKCQTANSDSANVITTNIVITVGRVIS